jgi:hypothetical protein
MRMASRPVTPNDFIHPSIKTELHMKERLNMFEQLFNESPTIQKIREQYLVKGRQEGLLALQDLLVTNVQARYPDLTELARASAGRSNELNALKLLIGQVMTAPNADAVRGLLKSGAKL